MRENRCRPAGPGPPMNHFWGPSAALQRLNIEPLCSARCALQTRFLGSTRPRIILRPLLVMMLGLTASIAPLCVATQNAVNLFGHGAILPAWIADIEVDIIITADAIEWRGTTFKNIHLPVRLKQRVIASDDASAGLAGGSISADASHNPDGITTLSLRGHEVELGQIAAFQDYLSGVPVDVAINLRSTGTSPRALAASATGSIRMRNSASGTIKKFPERPDKSSFAKFLLMLNPFRSEARMTSVECVVVELPVVDGIVDEKHVFELLTDVVDVKAAAKIDLAEESVYAAFIPQVHKGVNLSTLAAGDVVVLEGDLAAPEIDVMKGSLLEKGMSLGGAIAKLGPTKLFDLALDAEVSASLCAE